MPTAKDIEEGARKCQEHFEEMAPAIAEHMTTPKRPRGRPRGSKFPDRFMVRIPADGRERIEELAAESGEKVGDYARRVLGVEEGATPSPPESDPTCPSEHQSA